jgi:hypothetical protein
VGIQVLAGIKCKENMLVGSRFKVQGSRLICLPATALVKVGVFTALEFGSDLLQKNTFHPSWLGDKYCF